MERKNQSTATNETFEEENCEQAAGEGLLDEAAGIAAPPPPESDEVNDFETNIAEQFRTTLRHAEQVLQLRQSPDGYKMLQEEMSILHLKIKKIELDALNRLAEIDQRHRQFMLEQISAYYEKLKEHMDQKRALDEKYKNWVPAEKE